MNSQDATLEKQTQRVEKLNRLEVDMIDIFVRIARLFGVSKSVGEIYGLLFVSAAPVPLDYIRAKLNLSSGSASQGLRLLRTLGAVHATYVPGDRRDHFLAETGLRKITTGFLREKVVPDLMVHEEQLQRLSTLLDDIPSGTRPHIEARIQLLQSWRKQARAVLPIVMGGLETGI
jgi:HTH-type transcriptional regulator, glycine betaine synthesis regulator